MGNPGVLEEAYQKAGFHNTHVKIVPAPLQMASAAECVRFERESFGALHQMLSNIPDEDERQDVWAEIERELKQYETASGFIGPCELILGVGTK